jgi:drug/metabolite transporter (DMT)-like permease
MRDTVSILLAIGSAALFGAATPASKLFLVDLTAFQLAGLLYLGAALAMAAAGNVRRARPPTQMDAANRRRLAGAIIAGGMVAPVLVLAGLRLASAAEVALLLNLEMAATAVLGAAFFAEPIGRRGWLGVAGIVAAGALICGGRGWPGATAALLVAAACVCWGLDNHLTALIDGITPVRSTLWKGAVAGTVNLALGLAMAPFAASAWTVGAALLVGALSYGVSIALYVQAAQQLGAVRAQAVFASAPFLGAGLSWAVLGEPLTAPSLVAAALLAGSVVVLFSAAHAHPHGHAAIAHIHSHRHDDGHHLHTHAGLAPSTRHTHPHDHEPLTHAHPHWPDLHHRHDH